MLKYIIRIRINYKDIRNVNSRLFYRGVASITQIRTCVLEAGNFKMFFNRFLYIFVFKSQKSILKIIIYKKKKQLCLVLTRERQSFIFFKEFWRSYGPVRTCQNDHATPLFYSFSKGEVFLRCSPLLIQTRLNYILITARGI
jgi:hypothetical protein